MDAPARQGEGRFRWSRGGWFGAQLGATVWLFLLGLMLLPGSPGVGLGVLAVGLGANVAGLLLWRRRATLAPYPAIQLLVGLCGLAALASVLLVSFFAGTDEAREKTPSLLALLVYPGLMLLFHLQERSTRGRRSTPDAPAAGEGSERKAGP